MKKRILIVLAALTMLLCVPLVANAASVDDLTFDAGTGTITDCNSKAKGELIIPEEIDGVKVTSIGGSAFEYCKSLTSITIPNSVTSIGYGAFGSCKNLTNITIPDSVTSIGDHAFIACQNLTSVTIPDSVTSIGYGAFGSCKNLTNITIPESVTSIGDDTFIYCYSLTNIIISDSVTSIGDWAFEGCTSLTRINIPDSVTSIGYGAFSGCGSLNINASPNNQNYCDIDGVLFTKDKKTILAYAKDKLQPEYVIPNGVTSIGNNAFGYCESLTNITIPESVTSIGGNAFSDCESLTSAIPSSVTSIGSGAFYNTGYYNNADNWENNVLYIGDCLICADYELSGVCDIKNGTRVIANDAFEECKDNLTSVNIPNSVTHIGNDAFGYCESLTNITIPDSVISIGDATFRNCYSLTSVKLPDSLRSIGDGAFYGCTSLASVNIPNGVTSIGDAAFEYCTSLTSVKLPDSVTIISDEAFCNCGSLTSINIPNGVTIIGDWAFEYCTSLTNITIPKGVTSIGNYAFWYCDSLTNITIPDSVTSIGWCAFDGCDSLTDVYYSGTEREWKLIEIDEHNDNLLNANIHFMIDPLEVQPVEPEVDTRANKITIPVTVTDAERAEELSDVRLYIAEYDAAGRLTNVTFGDKGTVEGDTVTFTADIPDAEHYKIMLWDGNNAPLMDAVTSISE